VAETKKKTKVSGEFVWPAPDIDRLKAAVEGPVKSFVPEAELYATTVIEGPWQSETRYESAEDWLAGITPEVNRTWASFSNYNLGRQIAFHWQRAEGMIEISAETAASDEALAQTAALLNSLVAALGLKSKSSRRAERLFTPTGSDSSWIDSALRIAKEMTGSTAWFVGSWEEAENVSRETRVEADWLNAISKAQSWRGEWLGCGHRFVIGYRDSWNEVRIEVDSYDEASIACALEQIKTIPGLQSRVRDPQLQGEFRRYFLPGEAGLGWYEKALKLVRTFASRGSTFWGRVARAGEPPSHRGYGNSDVWWAALQAAMQAGDIATSYVSYRGHDRTVTFELDHYRDVLSIDLQSVGGEDVEQMHAGFATDLHLTVAPRDAYRYRRWGRTYDIRWIDAKSFAEQLESGFKALFPGRRVALTQAALHRGAGGEQVESFGDLSSFLKHLKEAKDLSELHLVADGPRGEFMGVHVDKELRRMRLLANTDVFSRFRAFENELKTALSKMEVSQDLDVDAEGALEKEKKLAWLAPVAVAILALLGTFMGSKVYEAMREPPVLSIDHPQARDGLAGVQSSDVTVSWTYKEPRIFGRPTLDHLREAWVDVTRESDGTPITQHQTNRGSVRLTGLTEGLYIVRVAAEDAYSTLRVQVKPEAAAGPGVGRQTQ
jgi:hypothetical protein